MQHQKHLIRQMAAVLMACGLVASLLPSLAAGQDPPTRETHSACPLAREGLRVRSEYAPAPAADAGLNRLDFSEEFNDYRGIDVNDSKRAGFNFYPDRPFSWPSTKRSDYSVQNGYLRIAADTNYSQQEFTSAAITGNCRWEGYTYDPAEPFYFETRVRWDPSRGVAKSKKAPGAGFPAAWSNPQQLRAGCGLNQHVEIDFVEWNNNWYSDGARHYTQALHLWTKGNDEQLVARVNLPQTDWGNWNTFGVLWLPGQRVETFFNGQRVRTYQWNDKLNPARGKDYVIIIGSGGYPTEWDWVRMWRGGSGGNTPGGDADNCNNSNTNNRSASSDEGTQQQEAISYQ